MFSLFCSVASLPLLISSCLSGCDFAGSCQRKPLCMSFLLSELSSYFRTLSPFHTDCLLSRVILSHSFSSWDSSTAPVLPSTTSPLSGRSIVPFSSPLLCPSWDSYMKQVFYMEIQAFPEKLLQMKVLHSLPKAHPQRRHSYFLFFKNENSTTLLQILKCKIIKLISTMGIWNPKGLQALFI